MSATKKYDHLAQEFSILSMSAHKWIDTPVVTPRELVAWLTSQRDRGYTLVGVEQVWFALFCGV